MGGGGGGVSGIRPRYKKADPESATLLLTNLVVLFLGAGYNRELPGFPRYSVVGTDESGVFNLQILNATLEDEAEYECQVQRQYKIYNEYLQSKK